MPRPVLAFLVLVVQLALCMGTKAQGRFVTDRAAVQAGVAFSLVDDVIGLGFGVGFFSDGVELGIQRTKISSDDDGLTAYAGYLLGYLVRPNADRSESLAIGPFIESIGDGRRSVVVGGVQLIGSQQVYCEDSVIIAPQLAVVFGLGLENYDGPPITGASFSLGLAVGAVRTAFLVIDPTVSVSGRVVPWGSESALAG